MKHKSLIIWLSIILVLSGCGKSDTPQNTDIAEEFTQQYHQNDVSDFMSKDKENDETSVGDDILNGNSSGPNRYDELMLKLENNKKSEESNIIIEEEPEQESNEIKEEQETLDNNTENIENNQDNNDEQSNNIDETSNNQDNSNEKPIEENKGTEKVEKEQNIVYVNNVNNPKFYHSTPDCTKLLTARSLNQMTIKEAIELGVSACKSCCN